MTTYFEFMERKNQRSVPFKDEDLVDFPGIVVTESEPDEDTLLILSLQQEEPKRQFLRNLPDKYKAGLVA